MDEERPTPDEQVTTDAERTRSTPRVFAWLLAIALLVAGALAVNSSGSAATGTGVPSVAARVSAW